nr:MAG TPA: hypothetical protein [Caudoviricetes sp.]
MKKQIYCGGHIQAKIGKEIIRLGFDVRINTDLSGSCSHMIISFRSCSYYTHFGLRCQSYRQQFKKALTTIVCPRGRSNLRALYPVQRAWGRVLKIA